MTSSLRALLVLPFVLMPVGLRSASAQAIQVSRENRTIAVTATGDASAPADTAHVTVGFSVDGNSSEDAYAQGSQRSNAIVAALHTLGLKDDSMESAEQNLSVVTPDDKRYAHGVRASVTQSWTVTTTATNAASVLNAAIQAGANTSGNIQWSLSDMTQLEASAAEKALAHAKTIAERMATGLNAKLGPLVYASNQQPSTVRVFPMSMTARMAMRKGEQPKPLSIAPEKVHSDATVYAVFAIE